MFMTTRRWTGLAMLLLAVVLGAGLQIRHGMLFHVETTTSGPEKAVGDSDCTIQIIEEKTYDIIPNWPVAGPLAVLACAGLALVLIPQGSASKRKPC